MTIREQLFYKIARVDQMLIERGELRIIMGHDKFTALKRECVPEVEQEPWRFMGIPIVFAVEPDYFEVMAVQ